MFHNFSFSLTSILLPWTYFQHFICGGAPHAPYRIPAEWTPHRRTLMAWPERISVDRDDQLHRARTEIAVIAQVIARYEPSSPETEATAAPWISSINITVKATDIELPWIRGSGPLLTEYEDGSLVGLDLNYKYLGSKTSFSRQYDAHLAARILEDQHVHRTDSGLALKSSSALEVDGPGTLLAIESTIFDTHRNPYASRDAVERHLSDLFGIKKIIWLPAVQNPKAEMTNTRVRQLARFAPNDTGPLSRPNVAVSDDDPAWHIYYESKKILQSSTNAAGHHLRVVEIEEAFTVPYAGVEDPGQLPATLYLSYYLPNGAVVAPLFGNDRTDDEAMRALREVWQGRDVVGVKVDMLAWMGGGVHAATMQWPLLGSEGEGNGDGDAVDEGAREDEL